MCCVSLFFCDARSKRPRAIADMRDHVTQLDQEIESLRRESGVEFSELDSAEAFLKGSKRVASLEVRAAKLHLQQRQRALAQASSELNLRPVVAVLGVGVVGIVLVVVLVLALSL